MGRGGEGKEGWGGVERGTEHEHVRLHYTMKRTRRDLHF